MMRSTNTKLILNHALCCVRNCQWSLINMSIMYYWIIVKESAFGSPLCFIHLHELRFGYEGNLLDKKSQNLFKL